jgi:hypothetical protein
MSSPRPADPASVVSVPTARPLRDRALLILWPAFLMAGVLETMTFAVVDPSGLHWFGGDPIEWSRSAVYSVTFLIYWSAIGASGMLTALLEQPVSR